MKNKGVKHFRKKARQVGGEEGIMDMGNLS
jgi:hypothetical protein